MEALTVSEALYDWVGMLGVALYLGSYAALQTGFLRGQGYLYPAINMAAAACVLISLANNFNLSSAIIQVSWIVISIIGIARMYYVQSRLTFTDNELVFMGDVLSGLPRERARRLLDAGLWMNAAPGTVMTRQGKPVDDLIYIASGLATVNVNGKDIATVGRGAVIGEVTYRTGQPATATVTVSEDTVLLRFEVNALRAFVARNADIGAALEQNLANHLRAKLTSMNANRAEAAE
jgi:CRP-like cAMP-binding protein